MRLLFHLLPLVVLLIACNSTDKYVPLENKQTAFNAEFKDIVKAADKRDLDLTIQLTREAKDLNAVRYGIEALGTMCDTAALPVLYSYLNAAGLLQDAAIYSIGQIGNPTSAEQLIATYPNALPQLIYEALGKCDSVFIATSSRSALGTQGIGDYIYQMAIQKKEDPEVLKNTCFEWLPKLEKRDFLRCAQALARLRPQLSTEENETLISYLSGATDEDLRIALLSGLNGQEVIPTLLAFKSARTTEAVTALRSLSRLKASKEALLSFRDNESDQVKQSLAVALSRRTDVMLSEVNSLENWKWKALSGSYAQNPWLADSCLQVASKAKKDENPFLFSIALGPLQQFKKSADSLSSWMDGEAPYCTYAAESYIALFENGWLQSEPFVQILEKATLSGKDGLVSLAAPALAKQYQGNSFSPKERFWEAAKAKLQLPAQAEAYCALLQAEEVLGGETADCISPYNHPISWGELDNLGPCPTALISTTKGTFTMELHPLESPSACASFVALANKGFYDNKRWHRVVPNFVAQIGCPNGDGYGSVDYTIRSDFGLHDYRKGAVGMASIGKDTESCQWFVTHSSTPHLEGRYTIFAYVLDGMEVVQNLDMDDEILNISLLEGWH